MQLQDCENGIRPVDHVEVARRVPREPRVALKTRPVESFFVMWVFLILLHGLFLVSYGPLKGYLMGL